MILSELEQDERILLAIITTTHSQQAFKFHERVDVEFQAAATHRLLTVRQLLKQSLNPVVFPDNKLDETRKILNKWPKSGDWLLNHHDFLGWADRNTRGKRLLVLYGIPGAGKTALSYIAYDHLLNQAGGGGGNEIYHLRLSYLPHQNNECLGAMQSLLYELASQNLEEMETVVDALDDCQAQKLKREDIVGNHLCRLFDLNGLSFLFIDGLDELKDDAEIQTFLAGLGNLITKCSGLRVFLSCRPEESIKMSVSTWNHDSIIITESLLRCDMKTYVNHLENIEILIRHGFNKSGASAYLDAVCKKSDGTQYTSTAYHL
ncbi:hypothetical protein ABW20_dc0109423 [Dactylellina cionopaga]|nr:hypothetical protein ABW20_dc0109423 [Dactylellina cionopaga]